MNYEYCPHCEGEHESESNEMIQECSICGEELIMCSLCKRDEYCKDCDIRLDTPSSKDEMVNKLSNVVKDLAFIVESLKEVKKVKPSMDIFEACRLGKLKEVKSNIESGVDVNAKGSYGRTALIIASSNGYLEMVKYLISMGADVNIEDDHGYTCLSVARHYDYTDVVAYIDGYVDGLNFKGGSEYVKCNN